MSTTGSGTREHTMLVKDSVDLVIGAPRWFDGHRLNEGPVHVAVRDDRVVAIGGEELDTGDPRTTHFSGSAILCPGFIDTHSHSDFSLVHDPRAVGALMQGITTQVVGQCGFSAAPLPDGNTGPPRPPDDPTIVATSGEVAWSSFADYRETLEQKRPAVNVVPFVGHNTLMRTAAVGDRSVAALAEASFAEGARGLSSGLSYHPGRLATDAEIHEVVDVAERHRTPYHTHMRYSAEETADTLERTLSRLAGRCSSVTVSHVFPRLRDKASSVQRLISIFDKHESHFPSLGFDVTVYTVGGTPWTHGLPEWAVGCPDCNLTERLTDSTVRGRVERHLRQPVTGWVTNWGELLVTKVNKPENRDLLGRSIAEIAAERRQTPEVTAIDIVIADGHYWVSPPNKRWEDVLALLADTRCIPMVDGITTDPRDPESLVRLERSWNAYRHFLIHAVRHGPIPLEMALRKLTAEGANRLAIADRGRIRVGGFADLVVLDLERLTEPSLGVVDSDCGIPAVMINGAWARRHATVTERRVGRVL